MVRFYAFLTSLFLAAFINDLNAQTANDVVPAYDAAFGQGMNFGWYPGWRDEELGMISTGTPDGSIPGVGVNTVRPALFGHFLEQWGYDIRKETFEIYNALGAMENVIFLDEPDEATQRGYEEWCPGQRSRMFRGMWEPIWDDNNGTPYNENNTYAAFLYKAVEIYGPHVRVYEVWNEPDIGDGPSPAWMPRGEEGNWFENPVDPCVLKTKAPVQAYVRMLRISYEVVKRLDPDAYVAVGGLGYASFLDNIMRMTDEPSGGHVTAEYPLTGGAYFDMLSFHVYPHIEGALRDWNNDAGRFDYTRNSDRAADGFVEKYDAFKEVLADYGYDGSLYPEKVAICTETGFPRQGYGREGAQGATPQMQRNFILKAFARAQQHGVRQVHPYLISDMTPPGQYTEFYAMGFYEPIENRPLSAAVRQDVGVASATYAELLRGAEYDAGLTGALALPAGAEGIGYRLPTGRTAYMLWARSTGDAVEDNTLSYAPSGDLALGQHIRMNWDYNVTKDYTHVDGNITLSASPAFFVDGAEFGLTFGTTGTSVTAATAGANAELVVFPSIAAAGATTVSVELPASRTDWALSAFDALGRVVKTGQAAASSTEQTVPVDVKGLPAGAYRIVATANGRSLGGGFQRQ